MVMGALTWVGVAGAVTALGGVVARRYGARLPERWPTADVSAEVMVPPARAFRVIDDVQGQAHWRREIRGIHPLTDGPPGSREWREVFRRGGSVRVRETRHEPPNALAWRLGESAHGPHVERTLELEATDRGCLVRLAEVTVFPSPWARLRARWLTKEPDYAGQYLEALVARLESPLSCAGERADRGGS